MRRLALLTSALFLPLLAAAPAHAAASVICVQITDPSCTSSADTIPLAITASDLNSVDDTILVGAGTYTDGPYILDGTVHAVTLKGAGQGNTILTLPAGASQDYVTTNHAVVQDLTVQMNVTTSDNDTGLALHNGSTASNVTVDGTGTSNALGVQLGASTLSAATVQMPLGAGGSTGVYAGGGSTVQDSTVSGDTGFSHSGTGTPDTVSRVTISASWRGVATDSGDVDVDDTLIDLGTSNATGLYVVNYNASTVAKSITADHVTIVGGGPSSIGAFAYAARSDVVQQASVTLTNSIVRGPATSLRADAGNAAAGGTSTATVTASYSDWQVSTKSENEGSNGVAQVLSGAGNLDVDPHFVDAAGKDYRLATGSPVIDRGDPAAGGPTTDRSGGPRVLDGNGDGSAVRDMGAYEHATVPVPVVPDTTAPDTRLTSKPAKRVTKKRVRFAFASTESGSTFACKLDGKAWRSCTSPYRFKVKVGVHRFQVRATDASGNSDATPATFRFRRVR